MNCGASEEGLLSAQHVGAVAVARWIRSRTSDFVCMISAGPTGVPARELCDYCTLPFVDS